MNSTINFAVVSEFIASGGYTATYAIDKYEALTFTPLAVFNHNPLQSGILSPIRSL